MLNATGKTPCSPNIDQCGFAQPAFCTAHIGSVKNRQIKRWNVFTEPSREAQSDPEQALEPVGAPGLGRRLAGETV